jgi:5'-nucleotidase
MKKQRIILDQDDVLADTYLKIAQIVVRDFGTGLPLEAFYNKPFTDILPVTDRERITKLIHEPGFFADIPLKVDSQRVVKALSEKYDIFIGTAAMEFPNSFREKYDWLQTHFGFIHWRNIVFCGDKSIFKADYLIDDMPRNFIDFEGQPLLFDAPHNQSDTQYQRVNNWEEIAKILL